MHKRFAAPGLILLGLCLSALGVSWNRVSSPSDYWTQQQADEFTEAQTELHARWHSHGDKAEQQQEFAAARDRFIKIRDELESARNVRSRTGKMFIWTGVAALLIGIGAHLFVHEK
jgi:hypothetical protein